MPPQNVHMLSRDVLPSSSSLVGTWAFPSALPVFSLARHTHSFVACTALGKRGILPSVPSGFYPHLPEPKFLLALLSYLILIGERSPVLLLYWMLTPHLPSSIPISFSLLLTPRRRRVPPLSRDPHQWWRLLLLLLLDLHRHGFGHHPPHHLHLPPQPGSHQGQNHP